MVEASLEPFVEKYLSHDQGAAHEAMALDRLASMGKITFDHQMREYSRLAGIPLEEVKGFMEYNPRNTGLLAYIGADLKPRFKIGFLSNASENWLDELFLPEDLALFDAFVLSYETGYAKPEAQIYEITADKLGVRCDECVFIDDRQEYVDGAIAVGMKAILYQNLGQLKRDIISLI